MVLIYVPIGQKNKLVKEEQETHISKLVGDGWRHEGIMRLGDMFGAPIDVVVLYSPE